MLRYRCSLLDHLLQKLVLDALWILLDYLDDYFLVLLYFWEFLFVVDNYFLLKLIVQGVKPLKVLHVSFASFDKWFWLYTEPFCCLVRRKNVHCKHLRFSFENILVFWQVADRDHFSYVSAIGARNFHNIFTPFFSKLAEACLTKRMSTLQYSWDL